MPICTAENQLQRAWRQGRDRQLGQRRGMGVVGSRRPRRGEIRRHGPLAHRFSAQNEFKIEVAGQTLAGTAPKTATWEDFRRSSSASWRSRRPASSL